MQREVIHLPPDTQPILSVVIHTEEEFDWDAPYDRKATTVEHMRHIGRAQSLFDEFGIVPNYVVGYPIATQELAYAPLREFADSGRALIGAHLHPWVSPPYEEEVNAFNSYPNIYRARGGSLLRRGLKEPNGKVNKFPFWDSELKPEATVEIAGGPSREIRRVE